MCYLFNKYSLSPNRQALSKQTNRFPCLVLEIVSYKIVIIIYISIYILVIPNLSNASSKFKGIYKKSESLLFLQKLFNVSITQVQIQVKIYLTSSSIK